MPVFLVLLAIYLVLQPARERYRHWRGPQLGDRDTVQANHLWLFYEREVTEWENSDE